MSDFNRGLSGQAAVPADMSVDAGLRGFMLGVYNKVGLGLVLSAALAWVTGTYAPVQALLFQTDSLGRLQLTLLGAVVMWAPVVILLTRMFIQRTSPRAAAIVYWSIVSLIGASLGLVFMIYNLASVFETFLVTAAAFGGLSIVGYTTKLDLSGLRSFLIMGVFGLIFALVGSMIFHSAAMGFAINLVGVLIFAGLIAADTQALKMTYYQVGGDTAAMNVATSVGALRLYLDFVNLFRFLLYFMGGARR